MGFPQTPLRWMAENALGADLTAAPSTWSWTDTSPYVMGPAITIDPRGRQSEFGTAPTAKASLKLIDTDGRWVEHYPLGAWYGLIGLNTPMRLLASPDDHPVLDAFGRTVSNGLGTADTGGAWTVVGTASDYAVTSGVARITHTAAAVRHVATLPTSVPTFDMTVRIRTAALATGAPISAGFVFRYVDASNFCRGELLIHTDQTIDVRLINRVAGVETTTAVATNVLTHAANTFYRLQVQYVRGATNITRIRAYADNASVPTTWQAWGTISAPATTGLCGLTSMRETGNTNANALVDFDDLSGTDGWWVRHAGYLDALPRRWPDHSASVLYIPTSVSGLSGRLQQATLARSAIKAGVLTQSVQPVAYWPLEDQSTATTIASAIAGAPPMQITQPISLGSGAAAGSANVAVVSNTGRIVGRVPGYSGTDWSVMWLVDIPSAPAGEQALMRWLTSGTYLTWQLVLVPGSPDTIQLRAYDSGNTEHLADVGASITGLYGTQIWVEVSALQSGPDVNWEYTLWNVGGKIGTKAGITAGKVTEVSFGKGSGADLLAGSTLGHISVWNTANVSLGANAYVGWAGEATWVRYTRLGYQEGVPLTAPPATTGATLMGPPSSGTLLAQIREIESTEVGMLSDDLDGSMSLLLRSQRYNQAVALTLDVTAGHVAALVPDNDNQQLVNDATSSQPRGGSYHAQDTTSNNSVTRKGVYPKQFTANTYLASDLQHHAEFMTALGTADVDRYTSVEISLTANPSLITSWLGCGIGSRIQITNAAALYDVDTIDLIIEGYTETISNVDWRVTLYTSSALPWNCFIVETGSGNQSRVDSGTSTLAAGVSSSATSLSVAISDPADLWVTGVVNFDIGVAGERMTVTNISGSSSPQTFTVTRHVNGAIKAQTALDGRGQPTKVSLWRPNPVGL